MEKIKISYIIPVYNAELYVKDCIDSILNQTINDIEVIVINDGSTDSSLTILQKEYGEDKRVIILSQENSGQGNTRNRGIKNARGKYIQFVDADDTLDPKMGELLYQKAEETGVDIVICAYQNINEYKKNVYLRSIDITQFDPKHHFADTCLIMDHLQLLSPPWNKLYRTEHIKNHFFKHAEPCEDEIYNIEEFCVTNKIAYLDSPLYYFYSRGNSSITHSYKKEMRESMIITYHTWKTFFEKQPEMKPEYQRYLDNYRFSITIKVLKNIYRFGSPFSFNQRTNYIKEQIIQDQDFSNFMKSYSVHGRIPKIFSALYKLKNPWFMNVVFTFLFFIQRKLIKKA